VKALIARLVHFEGYVQGVGFRYTATTLARRFDVTGYVMNMPDGTVDVYAEGTTEEIDAFLKAIQDEMGQYIHNTRAEEVPSTGQFRRFAVKY
jgi:acylphosphatase